MTQTKDNDVKDFEQVRLLVSIPSFIKSKDKVLYEVSFEDMETKEKWFHYLRYSELKNFNETLKTLKSKLPSFPGTKWFGSTNSSPESIEKRRKELEAFLQGVFSDYKLKDSHIVKGFAKDCLLNFQAHMNKKIRQHRKSAGFSHDFEETKGTPEHRNFMTVRIK